ncbi:acyl carrier protein [Nocardiopsis terrae]|uniref:Polyketide biosynthesis acyl carrier protein n=1 Tax=Nocardiopsis terrae TaxID=372655 RepID=A0ABR9HD02_9ACTN|nr:phosphopantetheine-binding protein [Nocardiopsis terrae]MBE1456912.1 polyketide biosynthesis acyl carrier protein [Nocardiopsis terrae]GHC74433.1 acyl carrier protein [Nocardiopsis terrae]
MTDEEIFTVVRRNLMEVVPELEDADIRLEHSMRELGANSIDRMDVVIASQEDLGITVPSSQLASVDDIASLLEVFGRHV